MAILDYNAYCQTINHCAHSLMAKWRHFLSSFVMFCTNQTVTILFPSLAIYYNDRLPKQKHNAFG